VSPCAIDFRRRQADEFVPELKNAIAIVAADVQRLTRQVATHHQQQGPSELALKETAAAAN
jgi:hypothetical protein